MNMGTPEQRVELGIIKETLRATETRMNIDGAATSVSILGIGSGMMISSLPEDIAQRAGIAIMVFGITTFALAAGAFLHNMRKENLLKVEQYRLKRGIPSIELIN